MARKDAATKATTTATTMTECTKWKRQICCSHVNANELLFPCRLLPTFCVWNCEGEKITNCMPNDTNTTRHGGAYTNTEQCFDLCICALYEARAPRCANHKWAMAMSGMREPKWMCGSTVFNGCKWIVNRFEVWEHAEGTVNKKMFVEKWWGAVSGAIWQSRPWDEDDDGSWRHY